MKRPLAEFLDDIERMPRLGGPSQLSREALTLLIEGGELAVSSLKVKVEDINETGVVLAFAFCDEQDRPIVNIGRQQFKSGDTMTIAEIANTLRLTIT